MISFNIPFIEDVAATHPALARTIEIAFYELFYGLVGALTGYLLTGDPISWPIILAAALAPIQAGLEKRRRDLLKENGSNSNL